MLLAHIWCSKGEKIPPKASTSMGTIPQFECFQSQQSAVEWGEE
jgi:hypothetical protein